MDWSVAAVAVKALLYAATLMAGGGVLFLALFASHLDGVERRRILRVVSVAAVAAIALTAARVMVLAAMLGDDVSGLWDWPLLQIVFDGSEGVASIVRAAGLAAVLVFSFHAGAARALAALGGLAAVGSFALTGHTGSIGPGDLPRFIVFVHLAGVAYWMGALVPLLIVASSPDLDRVAAVLQRFSAIAAVAVGGLIVAGGALLWLLVGTVEAALTSAYGQLVLLKLALVAGLLTLAAHNKFRLTPRIAHGEAAAVAGLRRSIGAEILLAGAILAATAVFTTVVGPPVLEARL
jgi:putative copper resistance protein D